MKTFSVAVAVAVVLTFICIHKSSAVPLNEQVLEEPVGFDNPPAAHRVAGPLEMNNRQKRGVQCFQCCYPTDDGRFVV
uniref:Hepcidin-like n=1 Tax=Stegastes partitus TaxID=144197 RepID=A0A3B5AHJ0_9TELE